MRIYKKMFGDIGGYLYQDKMTGPIPDYSSSYSKQRYDTYTTNDRMSELRFNLLTKVIKNFSSVTDFGYGNGAFLQHCVKNGKTTYGFDISDYPTPIGSLKIDNVNDYEVDVVTFYDSLEHLPEMELVPFLRGLKTKYVCISVPWYHEEQGNEWFMNWKHRRENEHLHHFDSHGLANLLNSSDYKVLYLGNCEDVVRTPVDGLPNILTVIAIKKNRNT
jgi:hypothetical protein